MKRQVYEGLRTPESLGAFLAEAERTAAERAWQRLDTFAKELLTDRRLQQVAGPGAAEVARAAYESLLGEEKQRILAEAPKPEAPKIHPRWEQFKTFTKELGKRAARQLWVNIKGSLKEFGLALAREMEIKMPARYGGRGGCSDKYMSMATEVIGCDFSMKTINLYNVLL